MLRHVKYVTVLFHIVLFEFTRDTQNHLSIPKTIQLTVTTFHKHFPFSNKHMYDQQVLDWMQQPRHPSICFRLLIWIHVPMASFFIFSVSLALSLKTRLMHNIIFEYSLLMHYRLTNDSGVDVISSNNNNNKEFRQITINLLKTCVTGVEINPYVYLISLDNLQLYTHR